MTDAQYHLYARLFDAALEVDRASSDATGRKFGAMLHVDLHGPIAGAALRAWASCRAVEVVPEVLERVDSMQRMTWTRLRVVSVAGIVTLISVHLGDDLMEAA